MLSLQSIAFAFASICVLVQKSSGESFLSRHKREAAIPVVVDVMFVCDKDFGDKFGQDRQRIVDYLAVWMRDVNMRFKTLTSVDITFRVTQLKIIQDKADQPFIEDVLAKPTADTLTSQMHGKFSEWAFANEGNFPNVDIYVLLTNAPNPDEKDYGSTYRKLACSKSAKFKLHFSTFVINHALISFKLGCGLLERMFATQIGAPLDMHHHCKNGNYILGTFCGDKRFFFSECSNKAIFLHVRTDGAACLRQNDAGLQDVLQLASSATHPLTITEQCQLETGDATAIGESDVSCMSANCYVKADGVVTLSKTMQLLDNTQCGLEKYCFRGRCLPQGHLLKNIGVEKCLHATNRFSWNDFLTLVHCPDSPSPLDQFMLLGNIDKGWMLGTPYSSPLAEENTDKCLSVDVHGEQLQYLRCDDSDGLKWDLIKINKHREFFLYHRETHTCAKVEENGEVHMKKTCNKADHRMRWRFTGFRNIPQAWLKPCDDYKEVMVEETTNTVTVDNIKHQFLEFPPFKLRFTVDGSSPDGKIKASHVKLDTS